MRIFSWNVNGIRAVIKKGEWQKFLTTYAPDIIGLQEIKANADQVEFSSEGYYKFYNSANKPGYAGTAIFSRYEPASVQFDLPAQIVQQYSLEDQTYGHLNSEGRVTTAEFKEFYFVTVYTPNTKDDLSRLGVRQIWDQAFLDYVKSLEKTKPVIFCGDLNVAHQPIDLANPKANEGKHGYTIEERAGFSNFLQSDFVDTFREFNSRPNQYSWWSHWANSRARNVGWRIDYVLISKSLRSRLAAAKIHPKQMGSDHCPVSIDIEVA